MSYNDCPKIEKAPKDAALEVKKNAPQAFIVF